MCTEDPAPGGRREIGANRTIANGSRIAPQCFIAAGTVITADAEPDGSYRGNPARRSTIDVDGFRKLNK